MSALEDRARGHEAVASVAQDAARTMRQLDQAEQPGRFVLPRVAIEDDSIVIEHIALPPDEARKLGERLVKMADILSPQKVLR